MGLQPWVGGVAALGEWACSLGWVGLQPWVGGVAALGGWGCSLELGLGELHRVASRGIAWHRLAPGGIWWHLVARLRVLLGRLVGGIGAQRLERTLAEPEQRQVLPLVDQVAVHRLKADSVPVDRQQ